VGAGFSPRVPAEAGTHMGGGKSGFDWMMSSLGIGIGVEI